MAQSKSSKGSKGTKGFGAMNEGKKREAASKGGRASAKSDTSNRGFASMDKEKQRKISSHGGKASRTGSQPDNRPDTVGRNFDISERDLNSMEDEDEMIGKGRASYSETDDDEDEGVGDGNLGRSVKSPASDEEG